MHERIRDSLHRKVSETTEKGAGRALEILAAAREAFALEGYAALSMRGVANRVGVTLGNVQHYYRTKDEMLEAMLVHSSSEYQASVNQIIASMSDAPERERFLAAMAYLIEETRKPITRGILLESLALAGRNSFAAQVCDGMIGRARRTMRRLIEDVSTDLSSHELDRRASLVLALMLGLLFSPVGAHLDTEALDQAARDAMLGIATQGASLTPPSSVRARSPARSRQPA